jgi:hypothetical protein
MYFFILPALFVLISAQDCGHDVNTICSPATDNDCRCVNPDFEDTGMSYNDCEQYAMDNGYDYFSVKDDKCRFGSAAECTPTQDSYGWSTYEIEFTDCTTNSPSGTPTDDATTTTCVGEEEVITICSPGTDDDCRCVNPDFEDTGMSYNECEQMASIQGYTHFSVKDDKCRFGSAAECTPTQDSYGWSTYEIQITDCTTNSPTEGEKYCWPNDASTNVVLADDMQSLVIAGGFAYHCDDGCVVTEQGSGEYILTKYDGSPNTFGAGAFTIAGSTLTWANNVVFTKDDCPECEEGAMDNSNPCNPRTCHAGQWMGFHIDCPQAFGQICAAGWVDPPEGECCMICPEVPEVTCRMTIDNRVTSIRYNGEDIEIQSGNMGMWGQAKIFSYTPVNNGVLEIIGYESSVCDGCQCSGLLLECDDGFVSSPRSFECMSSDEGNDWLVLNEPPCTSTSAFSMSQEFDRRMTKIWPADGRKWAKCTAVPQSKDCQIYWELQISEARCDKASANLVEVANIQECAESAAAGGRIEFSYKETQTGGDCLTPFSGISHIEDGWDSPIVAPADCNIQDNKGSWNHYSIAGCEDPVCYPYSTFESDAAHCFEHYADITYPSVTQNFCLHKAFEHHVPFYSYDTDSGECMIPGDNHDEQCIDMEVQGQVGWEIHTVQVTEGCSATPEPVTTEPPHPCANIACAMPMCDGGYTLVYPTEAQMEDGQCCPTCVEDCDVSYPMSIVGHDTRCMRQADYPEYEGLTCTQGGTCKTFIGVESAQRCHDMVQASCEDANAWLYRENCGSNCFGRCWAKEIKEYPDNWVGWHVSYPDYGILESDIYVAGSIGEENCMTTTEVPPPTTTQGNTCGNLQTEVDGEPCRVRRSWGRMSQEQQETYIQVMKDVAGGVHGQAAQDAYRALVHSHRVNFNDGLHWGYQFLPWHRWFILELENLFRQFEPCVTVPFWSWELDANDPNLWTNNFYLWGSQDYQFGSIVSPEGCVTDGPFGQNEYSLYYQGRSVCLERGQDYDDGAFDDMVDIQTNIFSIDPDNGGTWDDVSDALESIHDNVHCQIDGTMCTSNSSEDPLFFLHHANIDRLWYMYQNMGDAQKFLQSGESNYNDEMDHVDNDGSTPAMFTDMTSQGSDEICAIYQDLSVPDEVEGESWVSTTAKMTADVLNILNRLPADKEFMKKLPHSNEITLDSSRKFIKNIVMETQGVSDSEATVIADQKLEKQGRTQAIADREVVQVNERVAVNEISTAAAAGIQAFLGVPMDKLTETLSDEGLTDDLAFVNARIVTLDAKYMGGNVCDPNPCLGGGRCTVVSEEPVCECAPASGTYGQYCELHVCDIIVNPCLNGGTCGVDPTDGSAMCTCTDSFDGDFCEREICGDLAVEYAEEQRCAQEYGDDEQSLPTLEDCLQYAVDNGAEYFSYSESSGRCLLPGDAQDQCVTNPETGHKSWTIYTVGVDYESCIPCEDSHETTCENCSCSESAEDERLDGVRFETCFEHAMNTQKFFFSYNSRNNRCVIPASSGQCNDFNRQSDAYTRFNVYEVVYCDPPYDCDENGDTASIHQTGAYCQKMDVDIRDKNIGSVQACVDLAVANGASMFSMKIMTTYWGQTFHMCRIPMHNVMHQCTVEQENHSEDWNIYQLSGGCVTTPEPTFEINNPIETCPETAEHGDSCFEYVRGMVCDIDHHCCCGVCAYGGVATCEDDGTWSTAMR